MRLGDSPQYLTIFIYFKRKIRNRHSGCEVACMVTMRTLSIFLVLIALLFLSACGKQEIKAEPAAPAAEPASAAAEPVPVVAEPQPAPAPAAAPVPTGSAVLDAAPSQLADANSNVEVTKQQTILGETRDDRKFEDKSWFADLSCKRYTGAKQGTFGTGTKKEDALSFKVTNNDDRDFNLTWANAYSRIGADEKSNVPMKMSVNGIRLTNEETQKCCGTMVIKAGQTLECKECPANLRYPEQHKYIKEETEMINNLEVRSRFASSQIEFKCRN